MGNKIITTFQIFPGLEPLERLTKRFSGLSSFSQGTVIATGSESNVLLIENYRVVIVSNVGRKWLSNLRLCCVIVKEVVKLTKKNKINLIISYDPLKMGLYGLLVKFISGAKLLVEVNSEIQASALYDFEKGVKAKIKKVAYPNIRKFVILLADGVKGLFPGQLDTLKLKESLIVDYFFDYTSVSLGEYKTNSSNKIVTLGFPAYIKGTDILIGAFNQLSAKYPDWELEIVGYFNDVETRAMLAQANGNMKIKVLKPIQFSEVPRKIDSCNIFVLASRTEGMPRVLLEAMARGRARVASNAGGIPALLEDNVDGLIFQKESEIELREKLEFLMNSEKERKRLAESGIRRFKQEFTLDVFRSRTESIYRRVTGIM